MKYPIKSIEGMMKYPTKSIEGILSIMPFLNQGDNEQLGILLQLVLSGPGIKPYLRLWLCTTGGGGNFSSKLSMLFKSIKVFIQCIANLALEKLWLCLYAYTPLSTKFQLYQSISWVGYPSTTCLFIRTPATQS